MIQAVFGGDKERVLFVGLDRLNITRLVQDRPIFLDLREMGFPGIRLLVTFGETSNDLRDQLRRLGVTAPDLPMPEPGQKLIWTPDS